MISTTLLKKIARERLKDAKALFRARRYEGAIYLGGYVVEVALKTRICKTLRWTEFPHTPGEFRNLQSFKTHDLDVLLSLSGAENKVKTEFLAEWSAVATWEPSARYNPIGTAKRADAKLLIESAERLLRIL